MRGGDARMNGVTIALDLADVPPVAADPMHLQLVVGNLLANAIDASASGGAQRAIVTLASSSVQAGEVTLTVADTGSGIDAGVRRVADEGQGQMQGLPPHAASAQRPMCTTPRLVEPSRNVVAGPKGKEDAPRLTRRHARPGRPPGRRYPPRGR